MLLNYLKIAFRNIAKQRLYSLTNVLGLSLGIASSLFIIFYIQQELSYEKAIPDYDKIFRITFNRAEKKWAKSSLPMAMAIKEAIPEVTEVTRLAYQGSGVLSYGETFAEVKNGYFADSTCFRVFKLPFVHGRPDLALTRPMTMVITETLAQKFFPEENPLGKVLTLNDEMEYEVTGVVQEFPKHSHLKVDFVTSMVSLLQWLDKDLMHNKGWMFPYTYAFIEDKKGFPYVRDRLKQFPYIFYEGDSKEEIAASGVYFDIQPIASIHLQSHREQEMGPNGDMTYVYIFSALALLIILLASLNFINLFTTQAFKRIREIGVRKVVGAHRLQLAQQFLGEAFLMTLLAGLCALMFITLAMPFFNQFVIAPLHPSDLLSGDVLVTLGLMMVGVGLLSGAYPALYISKHHAINSLKGGKSSRPVNLLKKGLLIFQFCISVFMIICTIAIYQQLNFFQEKNLGFDNEHIIGVKLYGRLKGAAVSNAKVLEEALVSHAHIQSVGKTSNLIGEIRSVEQLAPEGNDPEEELPQMRLLRADEGFITTLGIPLLEGRNFQENTDSIAFLINEQAKAVLGLQNPVGEIAVNSWSNSKGPIVGVMKDFHFNSLHEEIEPLAIEYKPEWTNVLLVKMQGGEVEENIQFIKDKVAEISPGSLFSYNFLNDQMTLLYRSEDTMGTIFKVFSILGIFISCLGLFGLSAYASQVRTKEIGVRKVLGAGLPDIVKLLSREFIFLVFMGNLIAWPLAWWALTQWLQNFAYGIDISWVVFLLAGLVTVVISIVAVGINTVKAGIQPPIDSLKYE